MTNGEMRARNRVQDRNNYIVIDFREIFFAIKAKLHIVLLVGILTAGLAYAGSKYLITPLYTSTTKIYVMNRSNSDNSTVTYSDLQSGTQLTKDYMELVTSRPVLDGVISKLHLDMSSDALKKMISVNTPADTRILVIQVRAENPKEAKKIVDALREAIIVQIKSIMPVDTVNTIEEGNVPTSPSSPNVKKNTMIGGMLGILLVVGIISLIKILDDSIKTSEDVENYLELTVLASIPLQDEKSKGKKRRKSKR